MLSYTEENYLKALFKITFGSGSNEAGTNELASLLVVKPATVNDMLKKLKEKELVDYEKLRMLVIANEAWSIENGFLTPTMKIKRSRIESSVESQVPSWYEKSGSVFWA